jgi:hypothetical protein
VGPQSIPACGQIDEPNWRAAYLIYNITCLIYNILRALFRTIQQSSKTRENFDLLLLRGIASADSVCHTFATNCSAVGGSSDIGVLRMKIFHLAGTIPALALVLSSGAAMAATTFEQGFETDTSGWYSNANSWVGSIQRQDATGLGVTPFEGSYGARFDGADSDSVGPFTRFDGYRDTFAGTYSAQAAIYLDPQWSLGSGFEYSVASSNTAGNHLRDFIFHVTKDSSTGDLLVAGSNNSNFAPREDLEGLNNFNVTTAGWYIFEHLFRDDGGTLAVDLNLRDASGGLLFTETRNDPADTIPDVVGGNRYGWFTNISVDGGILVDSTQLNVPAPVPLPAAGWLLLTAFGGLGFAATRRRGGARRPERTI